VTYMMEKSTSDNTNSFPIGVGIGGARGARGAMAPLTSRDTLFPSYVTR